MHAGHLRVAVATLALCGFSAPAQALCAWLGPTCSTFWSYETVFEGTVLSIEQKPPDQLDPDHLRGPYRLVTFDVHRTWRGDPGSRVQLRAPGGPNAWVEDAFNFSGNKRYLVFARRVQVATGPALTTSKCDPTVAVPSKDAVATLAFLESLDQPSTGGRISGDVQTVRPGGGRDPLDATVVLEGEGFERRAVRTARGEYNFDAIPPGRYTVTVETTVGVPGERVAVTTIENPHQCRWVSFYLRR